MNSRFGVGSELCSLCEAIALCEKSRVAMTIKWLDESKTTGVFKHYYFEVGIGSYYEEDSGERVDKIRVMVSEYPSLEDLIRLRYLLLRTPYAFEITPRLAGESYQKVKFVIVVAPVKSEYGDEIWDGVIEGLATETLVEIDTSLYDFDYRATTVLNAI